MNQGTLEEAPVRARVEDAPVPPSEETPSSHGEKAALKDTGELVEPIAHLHAKTYLTVFAICCIYFAQLINIVGAGAQAQAITTFFSSPQHAVWLTSVSTFSAVVLSPIISQASDFWGRRYPLILLTSAGIPGSILVARSTSITTCIAGFSLTALSYGVQPLLHAVASEVLPRRYRPHGQAATNFAAAAGGLVALLAGGAMNRDGNVEGFRNYWYLTMACYAIATLLTFILYNPPKTPQELDLTTAQKLAKLDWIGYFLLAGGLLLFCISLSWSQNPYPWSNARVSATFAIGCSLLLALAVYEVRIKTDGMFHHGLFQERNFPIAVFAVFVEGLVFFAANNYFAFQISALYTTDTLVVGVRYGIMMIVYAIASVGAGFYCTYTRNVRWPTVVAFGFMILFFVLMATSGTGSSDAVWGYPVFLGIGLGVCLCSLVTIAQLSTPPELIAITSGLMISMRALGGSVGLAIYNAIFNEKLGSAIESKIPEAVLPLGLPPTSLGGFIGALAGNDNEAFAGVEGVTPEIIGVGVGALMESFVVGFRFVWIAAGCFTVAAAVASFFLVDYKKEFNMNIDNPAEKEEELYGPL